MCPCIVADSNIVSLLVIRKITSSILYTKKYPLKCLKLIWLYSPLAIASLLYMFCVNRIGQTNHNCSLSSCHPLFLYQCSQNRLLSLLKAPRGDVRAWGHHLTVAQNSKICLEVIWGRYLYIRAVKWRWRSETHYMMWVSKLEIVFSF